jgi:hypothetical protein
MTQDQDKSAITGDVAAGDRWEAKWYGSPPAKGCTVWAMTPYGTKDHPVFHVGPDEEHLALGRIIAEAHNAAISALSARIAEAEWQPIETAPKTGEEIIARKDRHAAFSCFWYGGRWTHYDIEDGYIAYEPDEWMPFPTSEHAARFLEGDRDHG